LAPALGDDVIVNLRSCGYKYVGPQLSPVLTKPSTSPGVEIEADGNLRINWHVLSLRNAERLVLLSLLANYGQPVSCSQLSDQAGIRSAANLSSVITGLRSALRGSEVTIPHCGRLSAAYTLISRSDRR
jgi:hypothetical protein